MEFKEYLKIFIKNLFVFIVTVLLVVGIGAGYKVYKNSKPKNYQVSLLINVTRDGKQETDTYRYDDFYRLQADERFADTVVRWIDTPRIVTDIYNETGIVSGGIDLQKLSGFFKAKRLSSQAIEVKYIAETPKIAQDISVSVIKALNDETKQLNQYQKEDSWFKVIGDEPVIKENNILWKNVLIISFIAGLFLGIWAVLIRHYLTQK